MNFVKVLILIAVAIMLASCSNKIAFYEKGKPKADLQQFFNGKIKAWGLIEDYKGEVTLRFTADIIATWDGNQGKLEEDFIYDNGKKQQRTWIIQKHQDGSFSGKANDIVGTATGAARGYAVNWVYEMDVPVGDSVYRFKFDDWMYNIDDEVWINRSYLKKFGITVAELTLFMQKQD